MDLLAALTTFIRVADSGSFSAVARQSRVSHSAVTRVIGQLEEHFSIRLFYRTTRRLNLTEDGQDLLGYARHVLKATEEMEGALGQHRASPTGLVRVGLPVVAANRLIPGLPGLLDRYPGLNVEFVIRDSFTDLIEERLDVALIGTSPPDSSAIARVVGTFGRIVVASPEYLERHGAPSHPTELAKHACVLHERGPDSTRWQFNGPHGGLEVRVSGAFRANNGEAVRRAVLTGCGIAQMSDIQVIDDVRSARLYHLLAEFAPPREKIYVVYPSRQHLAPRVRVVIDFIAASVRRLESELADVRVWGKTTAALQDAVATDAA
jgi:DNA-binding transcriptional LysR family regulator